MVEQKKGRRSSNCIFSIIFCLTNVETRVKAWHLSDRPVMFGGFKSNKRQRLQCVLAFRGSPLEISIKIFVGSQKCCQLPEELPTTRRQGLLPATAPLAAASNVIAQNAPRWRLLIAALIHNPLQCEVSIGPSDNGRHHKKQCHAPALLLPFITEQAVLK